jgi:hypothetical protein
LNIPAGGAIGCDGRKVNAPLAAKVLARRKSSMLAGVERLVDRIGPRESCLAGAALSEVEAAVRNGEVACLQGTEGHFAAVA